MPTTPTPDHRTRARTSNDHPLGSEGGCKISNFEVMYKLDRSHNWTPLLHLPLIDQKLILLGDLKKNEKYQVRITAFNEAGSTEAEYGFHTSFQGMFYLELVTLPSAPLTRRMLMGEPSPSPSPRAFTCSFINYWAIWEIPCQY